MATERWTDEMLDKLAQKVDQVSQKVDQVSQKVDQVSGKVDDMVAKSATWDDRFFQLSRDTLNFSRSVIVTAAVIAVITPALREALSATLDAFLKK
jgi:ABC-type transporter Mla subunit MlaD